MKLKVCPLPADRRLPRTTRPPLTAEVGVTAGDVNTHQPPCYHSGRSGLRALSRPRPPFWEACAYATAAGSTNGSRAKAPSSISRTSYRRAGKYPKNRSVSGRSETPAPRTYQFRSPGFFILPNDRWNKLEAACGIGQQRAGARAATAPALRRSWLLEHGSSKAALAEKSLVINWIAHRLPIVPADPLRQGYGSRFIPPKQSL